MCPKVLLFNREVLCLSGACPKQNKLDVWVVGNWSKHVVAEYWCTKASAMFATFSHELCMVADACARCCYARGWLDSRVLMWFGEMKHRTVIKMCKLNQDTDWDMHAFTTHEIQAIPGKIHCDWLNYIVNINLECLGSEKQAGWTSCLCSTCTRASQHHELFGQCLVEQQKSHLCS